MHSFSKSVKDRLDRQKLSILVFGPHPSRHAEPGKVGDLVRKRVEIRDHLVSQGHVVIFPESHVTSTNPTDIFTEEIILIQDADFIVVLVEAPGSIIEAGVIAGRATFAEKTFAFIDESYIGGLGHAACETIKSLRGSAQTFKYPDDIVLCHLRGMIESVVQEIQFRKLYP